MTHYTQRDTEALGEHYQRHLEAMTAEGLHDKCAIAAELAWRDKLLADLAFQVSHLCAKQRARFPGNVAVMQVNGDLSDAVKKLTNESEDE